MNDAHCHPEHGYPLGEGSVFTVEATDASLRLSMTVLAVYGSLVYAMPAAYCLLHAAGNLR